MKVLLILEIISCKFSVDLVYSFARDCSSAGLEHLPSKQRVACSSQASLKNGSQKWAVFFSLEKSLQVCFNIPHGDTYEIIKYSFACRSFSRFGFVFLMWFYFNA